MDDDPDYRAYVSVVLGRYGYRVLEAADGADALLLVASTKPSLILIDWTMPCMSGEELHRLLSAYPGLEQTPVGFISASDLSSERTRGAVFRLRKPTKPDDLIAAVRAYARRSDP